VSCEQYPYRSLIVLLPERGRSSSRLLPNLLFGVQRHGAQLLLVITDDLTPGCRGEAVTEHRRVFRRVIGAVAVIAAETVDDLRQRISFVYGNQVEDAAISVQDNVGRMSRRTLAIRPECIPEESIGSNHLCQLLAVDHGVDQYRFYHYRYRTGSVRALRGLPPNFYSLFSSSSVEATSSSDATP